jgi:hypothetical protein
MRTRNSKTKENGIIMMKFKIKTNKTAHKKKAQGQGQNLKQFKIFKDIRKN